MGAGAEVPEFSQAIAAPRPGRARRPNRPRAHPPAKSEEDGPQLLRRRVKVVDQNKTKDEEEARSNRLKTGRFGSALTTRTADVGSEGARIPEGRDVKAGDRIAETVKQITARLGAVTAWRKRSRALRPARPAMDGADMPAPG